MDIPKMMPKKLDRFKSKMKKTRVKYQTESKIAWLKDLLDAYHIIDAGIEVELESQTKRTGRKIACHKGCFACCFNPSVKINDIELRGLSWFLSEEMDDDTFSTVYNQLENHLESSACPFLASGNCSVYPVRPIACRIAYVFDNQCTIDEDVYKTRPDDMIYTHGEEVAWMVSQKIMPHLGIHDVNQQRKLFEYGYMFSNTREMHTLDWSIMASRSKEFRTNKC